MRIFLSHSSRDADLVREVHQQIGAGNAWIDFAEIEWGDRFLAKISEALGEATDFVLFWSANSGKSRWVEYELNAAFIRMMNDEGISLRIVRLDNTELPFHLGMYQYLDVSKSKDPVAQIVEAIGELPSIDRVIQRNRFLNRSDELSRLETAVDAPETFLGIIGGFAGIGKSSLATEGLRRFYRNPDFVQIDVRAGTGLTELALYLSSLARAQSLPENLSIHEIKTDLRLSMEELIRTGRFFVLTNIQHWLDEDGMPSEPLTTVLGTLASIPGYRKTPCLMTSTRRIAAQSIRNPGIATIWLEGLPPEHVVSLVRLWHEISAGKELDPEDAALVASQVHGHPIAAQLAAGLVSQYGVQYLQQNTIEYVSLRRDLAKQMLLGMRLRESTLVLMKALAAAEGALPPVVLSGVLDAGSIEFHQAVSQATGAGLITTADGGLRIHPLIAEHFGNILHREDYTNLLLPLAHAAHDFAMTMDVASPDFSVFIPVVFRLYAYAGELDTARNLRRDLHGELEAAAIFHYNRRNYGLAWDYVNFALDAVPSSWRMMLYKARILVRREEWPQADEVLDGLLTARPRSRAALHAKGWRLLREERYREALSIFSRVIAQRDHVASLRDAAACLHALSRDNEALGFLARAKAVDIDDPYVLDLEAQILEYKGDLHAAYESAYVAMLRDPQNWAFHHRLGRIRVRQRRPAEGIIHLHRAAETDPNQFTPLHALTAANLDVNNTQEAEQALKTLETKASNSSDHALVEHLKARVLIQQGHPKDAASLLEGEIRRNRNLLPNLGLLAEAKILEFDHDRDQFPAGADVALWQAEDATKRGLLQQPDNEILAEIQAKIHARRELFESDEE